MSTAKALERSTIVPRKLAEAVRRHPAQPTLKSTDPFRSCFDESGKLIERDLDRRDGEVESIAAQCSPNLWDASMRPCVQRLRCHTRATRKVEAQHVPSAIALLDGTMTPGQIVVGLIRVGTKWCFNAAAPLCSKCLLRGMFAGANDCQI